jgi:L-asparagine transporter-like permease
MSQDQASASQTTASKRSPEASLGLLDATMVGMGAMIGAGIFVLTGLAAEKAGPGAIIVFALNGVVTTFTALSYAELASAITQKRRRLRLRARGLLRPACAFMSARKRTTLLTAAGLADLACFVLGSFGYGHPWSVVGAVGLLGWLVLIELTQTY